MSNADGFVMTIEKKKKQNGSGSIRIISEPCRIMQLNFKTTISTLP